MGLPTAPVNTTCPPVKSNGSSSVQSPLIHSHASASASTLFNTMDFAAQYYDCCVENALLGLGMFPTGAHPFHPRIPPAPATPKGPIEDANRDGPGPDDYRSYNPSVLEKGYLQGVRAAADQTSIYDYYNWDTTKKSPSEQYSDLNDLHRAGWAQNYEVTNTSSPQTSMVRQPLAPHSGAH